MILCILCKQVGLIPRMHYYYYYYYYYYTISTLGYWWLVRSATGWCHQLDILAKIKVHIRIGCSLVYLPTF